LQITQHRAIALPTARHHKVGSVLLATSLCRNGPFEKISGLTLPTGTRIKDLIIDFRHVPASELLPNPKDWRTHSTEQADALNGIPAEIGIAGAVLARRTPDGLILIDGISAPNGQRGSGGIKASGNHFILCDYSFFGGPCPVSFFCWSRTLFLAFNRRLV
jgi:hypothetical protein